MRLIVISIFLVLLSFTSCVSKKTHTLLLQNIDRLKSDSLLLEKRTRSLQDQVHYLQNQSATMEQALTQRLQEKEDSLNHKQQQLQDKEASIKDMKSRKAEEREAFTKLSSQIIKPFTSYAQTEVVTRINCTQTVVEIADQLLFQPNSTKIDQSKIEPIASKVSSILNKQPDLKLIIVCHPDSVYVGKEKWDDNWAMGSTKANNLAKLLIKDYGLTPQRIMAATQADYIELTKANYALGKNRTAFLFYSELLPCIHLGE